ncbi:MAG: ABC transporter permease [Lachnospiraceae bacterium]|jgi:ABC-2 type transport system permease protein|nr:ABC transporter permease [Lachnospiraceae bacterium]
MRSFGILLKYELKLTFRNMNMIISAVLMPLVVMLFLGLIYGTKPAGKGLEYTFIEQSFGALCAISICAGGLMGLPLAVSEYRERGVLKRFWVTPVSPVKLLAVEFTVYMLYCLAFLLTLAAAASVFCKIRVRGSLPAFMGSWLFTMVSTLSIGMMAGGVANNTKSAGLIACFLYFPMLIFSGTTIPFEIMPEGIQRIVSMFPMVQGIQLMKKVFLGIPVDKGWILVCTMAVVTGICAGISVRFFKWEVR